MLDSGGARPVIATPGFKARGEAIQRTSGPYVPLDCFVAGAPRNDNSKSEQLSLAAVAVRRLDQDRAEVVDVGERWAGDDEVAKGGEDGVGIVVVEAGARVEPER